MRQIDKGHLHNGENNYACKFFLDASSFPENRRSAHA
jgi:hypothetical protein